MSEAELRQSQILMARSRVFVENLRQQQADALSAAERATARKQEIVLAKCGRWVNHARCQEVLQAMRWFAHQSVRRRTLMSRTVERICYVVESMAFRRWVQFALASKRDQVRALSSATRYTFDCSNRNENM